MGQVFETVKAPARKFKSLPEKERKLILAILGAYMQGAGVIRRSGKGIEGTLEWMIGLCDSGRLKIKPTDDGAYALFWFEGQWEGYVEKAVVRLVTK